MWKGSCELGGGGRQVYGGWVGGGVVSFRGASWNFHFPPSPPG